MALWTFGTVESEPHVRLMDWRVMEATYADNAEPCTRHFVGSDPYDGTGRVSSAIASFDIQKRRGITRSGRVYELLGRSRGDSNAEYVWKSFCNINGISSATDVSQELIANRTDKDPEVVTVEPTVGFSKRGKSK